MLLMVMVPSDKKILSFIDVRSAIILSRDSTFCLLMHILIQMHIDDIWLTKRTNRYAGQKKKRKMAVGHSEQ